MRKYLLSLAALVLLIPTLSFAADLRTTEVVTKEETPTNLYLAGENPTVDANISGDLVVAGGVVTVNGDVENSVLAAGGTLNLNGRVGNSIRVAGGTVNIESNVGGDIVVFGGDIILGTKSVVAGDLLVFGGTVTIRGEVQGSVKKGYAGNVTIAGTINGDVELASVGTLTVDETAVIGGDLRYSSRNEAIIASQARVGGDVSFTKITEMNNRDFGPSIGSVIFGMLTAFITLFVFAKLFPKFAKDVANESLVNPLTKMGVGFLAMVATPVALLLLLITFFGWGIMGYLGLAYVTMLALTGTLTAVLVGSYVWKYFRKESELSVSWKTILTGVAIVGLLKLVPVIGWLIAFALGLIVFGTLTNKALGYIKAQRA